MSGLILLFIILSGIAPPILANTGVNWLTAQAQPFGHYSTPDDLATPFQATAETWRTFYQMGSTTQPTMTAALDAINAESFPSTEHLARILITRTLAGQPVNDLITTLTARLQNNGGLGDLSDYNHTVIDTAFALEALAMTSFVDTSTQALYPAIDFLLQSANNGGWGIDNEILTDVTAIVMHALWHYRHHVSHIPSLDIESALDQAQAYLLNKLAQGENETFETALALIAILPRLTNRDEISGTIDALRAAQLANGSWDNDVYTTALALRALHMAETPIPNPDLGQIMGTVIDGQTGLALSGINVQLTGTTTSIQTTNPAGEFNFSGLIAGNYTVQIGDDGAGLTTDTQVNQGQMVNLGNIRFFRGTDITTIQGTITDATTSEALVGATILVTGITETIVTNEQGSYLVSNIEPGDVMLQASHEGYLTASTNVTVTAGATLLFSLALSPDVVAIKGIVTDGNTNAPLSGAQIFLNGTLAAQTEADGSYLMEGLSSGEVHLLIEHDGYDPIVNTVTLPTHTIVTFSPQLYPTGSNPTIGDNASVMGTVVDKATGLPLPSVTVTSRTQTVTTNDSGQFNLTHLAAGETLFQLSIANYREESLVFILSPFTQLDLGEIALIPEGYQIPVGVKGIVMDASANQPLADVNILAQFGETTQTLVSNAEGLFDITSSVEDDLSGQLSFTIEGYVSYTLDILFVEDEILDIGQVRLRPEEVTVLLPDLVVKVDNTGIHTDPQTLTLSGNVMADVSNIGTAPTSSNIALLSFYDVDLNGVYETEVDISLGEAVIENALAVEENATIAISLTGSLPFRDAPIKVWVDNLQAVVESDEQNNVGSTAKRCEVVPDIGTFEPVLKWEWTGSDILPDYNQVMSIPIVAPLEDTNGDGKINQFDIPNVIFSTYDCDNNISKGGILRAVRGTDGSELWTISDNRVIATNNIAVADIDHDGIVEIIATQWTGRTGVIVFEHTGEVKWQVFSSYYFYATSIVIADLNGDSTPEIIIGNTVLNATDGSLFWPEKGYTPGGGMSAVADIDLDGKPEVIVGTSAYSNTGQPLWSFTDFIYAFTAIGNFNEDNYPEIVAVSSGKIALFDYRGKIIWGPIYISYGGGGVGNPTIADMNGDGIPEIGVVGRYKYVVFQGKDGSELWTSYDIRDSSGYNSSSAFDFDGDGQAELIHAGNYHLQIIQGKDGSILAKIPNTSGTAYEYPVIVDVDNDNHADIVVASNSNFQSGSCNPQMEVGIRVYQDKNNNWPNTRKIWNQHSYHITNINDDGTVPAVEPNSWEVHNTYRAQPVLSGGSTTGIPDLTIGRLLIIDNGVNQPVTLQVRIGNAGLAPSTANLPLTFYAGDPANNGTELGTVMLDTLAPSTYQDVQLPAVFLSDLNQDIYAVVDAQNTLEECNENNNSVWTSVKEATPTRHGKISLTTDAPSYGPNTPVLIDYTLTN